MARTRASLSEPGRRGRSGRQLRLKPLDFPALLLALLAVGSSAVSAYSGGPKNPDVIIEASGQTWIYPLREDRQVAVAGPLGGELIAIQDGKAFVVTSPCPNQICIQQGRISRPGQWIACLPNRIFIRIGGKTDQSVDGFSW